MLNFLTALACLILAASPAAGATLGDVRTTGSLTATYSQYPEREVPPGLRYPSHHSTLLDARLALDLPVGRGFSGRIAAAAKWAEAETQWDFQDGRFYGRKGGRLEWDELYLDYRAERWEIRAGNQIVSWKVVESYSPADFLNQRDYRLDFLSPEKLSEFLVRGRFSLTDRSDHILELLYLPWFTAARLPGEGHRLDPAYGLPYLTSESDPADHAYLSSAGRRRTQGGVRYLFPLPGSFDGSLFLFHGYARLPVVEVRQAAGGGLRLTETYVPATHAGGTFQGALGGFLLKGEMLWQQKEERYRYRKTPSDPERTMRPYAAWAAGSEYTWYGILGADQDFTLFLEHLGSSEMNRDPRELESFRPFVNHVFSGVRYAGNGLNDRTLIAGAISSLQRLEETILVEYQERLWERLRVALKAEWLVAAESSVMNSLEPASAVSASLRAGF